MMKKTLALVTILFSPLISAQPAVYENGLLTIPQAAVIESSGSTYYSDIQLEADANGSFRLLSGTAQSLVAIDSVVVNVMESLEVQVSVTVNGHKSVPCVQLLDPSVSRNGSLFTIVLAESSLGPAETCIAQIDPFETSISLDVKGLSAGSYQVEANGVSATFELTTNNG